MIAGGWLLVVGYWLLVLVGCWLLLACGGRLVDGCCLLLLVLAQSPTLDFNDNSARLVETRLRWNENELDTTLVEHEQT